MQKEMDAHVMTCLAEHCSWNCMDECCAPAIEVGDDHPRCDTFTTGSVHPMDVTAVVRDCKVTHCRFNHAMECGAAGITLNTHAGHADCLTYRH